MTERELRDAIQTGDILCGSNAPCSYCAPVFEALADWPDMAKLLRWADLRGDDTHIWQDISQDLADYALEEFHIRLTETGWEWTDDTS